DSVVVKSASAVVKMPPDAYPRRCCRIRRGTQQSNCDRQGEKRSKHEPSFPACASTDCGGTAAALTALGSSDFGIAHCLRERMGPHSAATYHRAIESSHRRPRALRAREAYQAAKMSRQGVLLLFQLLTAHSAWQELQSIEDKERSPPREASS